MHNFARHQILQPYVKDIVGTYVMHYIQCKSIRFKYFTAFWLLKAGHGYLVYYQKMWYSNITAQITFYDGPKTFHRIVGILTGYFSSLVQFEISENSSSGNYPAFFRMAYTKFPYTIMHSLNRSIIHIKNNDTLMHKQFMFEPENDTFLSVSFQIRSFSGSTIENCYYYGGYILLEHIKMYASEKDIVMHGPYCNLSISNYPLVINEGIQKLYLGRWKTVILIYAYGPLYTIDLDIIIHKSLCEGIINPITFCKKKHMSLRWKGNTNNYL